MWNGGSLPPRDAVPEQGLDLARGQKIRILSVFGYTSALFPEQPTGLALDPAYATRKVASPVAGKLYTPVSVSLQRAVPQRFQCYSWKRFHSSHLHSRIDINASMMR